MIVTREQLDALFAGDVVEHTEPVRPSHRRELDNGVPIVVRPYSKTRSYAAQLAAGKTASCRVHVLACVHDAPHGVWRLHLKMEKVRQEPARLLKRGLVTQVPHDPAHPRSRGYTDRPSEALSGEPEAIDAETQDRYSREAVDRHRAFKDTVEDRPLEEQLAYELRRAEAVGVDATHSRAAIQRRIRALRRLIDQRAANAGS